MAQANPIHVNARRVVAAAFRAFLLSVDYPSLSPLLSVRFMGHYLSDNVGIGISKILLILDTTRSELRTPLRILLTYALSMFIPVSLLISLTSHS